MAAVEAALRSHPARLAHPDTMSRCMEACFNCAGTCTACADACLSERGIEGLLGSIRQNLDCAAICLATGSVVTRSKAGASRQILESQLSVCIAACRACGDECRRYGEAHRHCRVCAQVCDDCAQACTEMLAALRAVV
jgi:Domain of Unknown Function (DUF326)